MDKKYVRVDIMDDDYFGDGLMDTYILVNPNMEKLKALQDKVHKRYDEENEFRSNYGAIYDYITENFELLPIADFIDIEW